MSEELSEAIRSAFGDEDYGVLDVLTMLFKGEDESTIVDAVHGVAGRINRLADSITPNLAPGIDATGSPVGSLTEAVCGATAGLVRIAHAIDSLADAVASLKATPESLSRPSPERTSTEH